MSSKWINRWNSWIADAPSRPGVWRRKEGGFLVRGRATDPRTGKMREVKATLVDCDADAAFAYLQEELRKVRSGMEERATEKMRFKDFAVSLLEDKVAKGHIRSAKGRQKWGYVLEQHLLPKFGDFYVDQIRYADIDAWQAEMGKLVKDKQYSPHSANDWLAVLKVVMNAATKRFELARNPVAGIDPFDTSTHQTYTEEEPNALLIDELRAFLGAMKEQYPQHFAMVALGFCIGHRPSTLRPLRRRGVTPDVLWEKNVLLLRRSQTVGDEVMEMQKTGIRQRITLPQEMMDILQWHVDQLPEGAMRDSDLLFPSDVGGFRSPSSLDKPFREVAKAIGLKKHITPKGMRRTFQDLARAADVHDLVTRSISGHLTETMQHHYSTVSAAEQLDGLAKVISLAGVREAMAKAPKEVSYEVALDEAGERGQVVAHHVAEGSGGVHPSVGGSIQGSGGAHGGVHDPKSRKIGS